MRSILPLRHLFSFSRPYLSAAMSTLPSTRLASRMEQFGLETVWQEFSPLAAKAGAVNLGQGFPDWKTPDFVKAAMNRAIDENQNQYCRSAGLPSLVQALARKCVTFLNLLFYNGGGKLTPSFTFPFSLPHLQIHASSQSSY